MRSTLKRDDVKTSFYLSRGLLRAAKAQAAAAGVSLRAFLVRAVASYLEQQRKEDRRR